MVGKRLGCKGIQGKVSTNTRSHSPAPHSLGLWQRVQGRITAIPEAKSTALSDDVWPSAAAVEANTWQQAWCDIRLNACEAPGSLDNFGKAVSESVIQGIFTKVAKTKVKYLKLQHFFDGKTTLLLCKVMLEPIFQPLQHRYSSWGFALTVMIVEKEVL